MEVKCKTGTDAMYAMEYPTVVVFLEIISGDAIRFIDTKLENDNLVERICDQNLENLDLAISDYLTWEIMVVVGLAYNPLCIKVVYELYIALLYTTIVHL